DEFDFQQYEWRFNEDPVGKWDEIMVFSAPHEPVQLELARELGISSRAEPRLVINLARLIRAEL
ncbi:11180_t:CDS:1, partial [Rhizophagus irregularis]